MKAIITRLVCILSCIVVAGCVTSVDESLPYDRLPEITVATQFNLVASPSHPTSYLSSDPIPVGEKVQVIGTDKDAAWLLVMHDNLLGWMPTFYSRTNVGTLRPAIVVEPLADKCTKYLGATFAPDEAWVSNTGGSVLVLGSIYRPQAGKSFEDASLVIEIVGSGTASAADYVYMSLTASNAVVLFVYSIDDLRKGSQIRFNLTNPSNEALSFEAAFFRNDCTNDLYTAQSEFVDRLPVGKAKISTIELAPTQEDNNRKLEASKGSIIISTRKSDMLPTSYLGSWEGHGVQASPSSSWTTLMTLIDGEEGSTVGTIAYPSLGCGGKLSLANSDSSSIELFENIIYGNCVDKGTLVVTPINSQQVNFEWHKAGWSGTASGSMTRIATWGVSVPQQYIGIWEGETNQGGHWTVLLGLSDAAIGTVAGTIAYPSLQCGGELTISDITDKSIELSQDITYGSCVDNLIVVLGLQDSSTIHYQEQRSNGQVTGSGTLTKISKRSKVKSDRNQ